MTERHSSAMTPWVLARGVGSDQRESSQCWSRNGRSRRKRSTGRFCGSPGRRCLLEECHAHLVVVLVVVIDGGIIVLRIMVSDLVTVMCLLLSLLLLLLLLYFVVATANSIPILRTAAVCQERFDQWRSGGWV